MGSGRSSRPSSILCCDLVWIRDQRVEAIVSGTTESLCVLFVGYAWRAPRKVLLDGWAPVVTLLRKTAHLVC